LAAGSASVNRKDFLCGLPIKMSLNTNKNPEDILQEEFLRERAAVLGRAGESVSRALEKLWNIEMRLEERLSRFREIEQLIKQDRSDARNLGGLRRQMMLEINREISKFNGAREYALMRHYYLIVTREAMGMRRHHWVEQHYRVPPLKKHLQDG
jgi:hypothetical protein